MSRGRSIDAHPDLLHDVAVVILSDLAFKEWVRLWVFAERPHTCLDDLRDAGLVRVRHDKVLPLSPKDQRGRVLVKPTVSWSRSNVDAVFRRDGARCRYCGAHATTIDHVIPRSQGGTDEADNLVACCRRCNSKKWARTPEQAGMALLPCGGVT